MFYEGMSPVFETVPFDAMNKKQAERYLEWYILTMDERLRYLEEFINKSGTKLVLDKSPESLIPLWDWFSERIEMCEKSEEELAAEMEGCSEWEKDIIKESKLKFSHQTVQIAYDISGYFGEVVIKNNPEIRWGCLTKPKRLDGVNRPRLLGFAHNMSIYTYGRIEVCMWKTLREKKDGDLYRSYEICLGML